MNGLETRLFCRLDGLSAAAREQQRLFTVADLGLLETDSIPVFQEAAQTAAQFLEASICWLGILDRDTLWLKSAQGLSSHLGLMNPLAKKRRMVREDSFDTHVVDSQQVLALEDAALHPAFAQSVLVQQFGIRAYLGAPLMASSGQCLGTLAVLETEPRAFTRGMCSLWS
ncbi:MAG: GAF domain-containing protein [Synechococcales cyanobacterium RM1_1_8]|nr:GAF domain-containing protein [Synechococcales cyanobacterium RM1_1_8]